MPALSRRRTRRTTDRRPRPRFRSSMNTRFSTLPSARDCPSIFTRCPNRQRRRWPAATGSSPTPEPIRIGGNREFYAIDSDYVRMPHFETFVDAESHKTLKPRQQRLNFTDFRVISTCGESLTPRTSLARVCRSFPTSFVIGQTRL